MKEYHTNPAAENVTLKVIARIQTAYSTKFGVPRQSGLVTGLESRVVFEPDYRNADALKGLDGYSHLWLIWSFSEAIRGDWSPTVRPPWLGGNTRMGVFATRSPYRPNPLALSSVRLLRIEETADGMTLVVDGADMMDGTPIYDIKPYLPFSDSHPDAQAGFSDSVREKTIDVDFPEELAMRLPEHLRKPAEAMLAQNPTPRYQKDTSRIYGVGFSDFDIRFQLKEDGIHVVDVAELNQY